MDDLSREDLLFLIEEINKRLEEQKKSLKKYHKSAKGIEARKRASKTYYDKITKERVKCECGKSIYPNNMTHHLNTKLHENNLKKINLLKKNS